MMNSYAGPPGYPSNANPTTKNTTAARANTHKELNIMCAALRDRPSPALMMANPAAANGTSRMNRRHSPAATSVRTCAGAGVTPFHRAGSDENEPPASRPPTRTQKPASAKAVCGAAFSSAIAARTMIQPATCKKNPSSLMKIMNYYNNAAKPPSSAARRTLPADSSVHDHHCIGSHDGVAAKDLAL